MTRETSNRAIQNNNALKVVFLPQTEIYEGNPYWTQLQTNLEQLGVVFVQTEDKLFLQWRWLLRNRRCVNVIHFHFLKHHFSADEKYASTRLLMKFLGKLLLAKLLGYRIVWTLHNLSPHEKLEPESIGWFAHLAMAQLANAVIVHCESARRALAQKYYRRRSVFTIFHPSYIEVYPNTLSKKEARGMLKLADGQRMILFLGTIRAYKGVEQLIKAFQRVKDDNLVLVIAGKLWHSMSERNFLQDSSYLDKRIFPVPKFIPDKDLQIYYNAADVVVLPYTNVLSSGSALLAMSFGCPIIAPAVGCLTELITADTGVLYDPSEVDGLYKALLQALLQDQKTMGENAYKRAAQFTWEGMARKTLQVYRSKEDFHKINNYA
ncbi:MAG TPA: glycosyltransferase family 4 protein [Oculatellaceae cyanobacterium]